MSDRPRRRQSAGGAAASVIAGALVAHTCTALADQVPSPPPPVSADASAKQLFETHCGACHSLDLPRSQRLDRNTWRWVMDDMVNKYGATWITDAQQTRIIEYLVEHYGPDRPRAE